jgi:hypothetical protein
MRSHCFFNMSSRTKLLELSNSHNAFVEKLAKL